MSNIITLWIALASIGPSCLTLWFNWKDHGSKLSLALFIFSCVVEVAGIGYALSLMGAMR